VAYAILASIVVVTGFRAVVHFTAKRVLVAIAIASTIATVFLLAAGYQLHFRVLARHFTPIVVIWLLLCGAGIHELSHRNGKIRIVAWAFLFFSVVSCLQLRFAHRHAKDDYRGAAKLARNADAQGKKVWWNADANGASYYGATSSKRVVVLINPVVEELRALPAPDVVIVSKPDLYDLSAGVTDYLRDGGYRKVSALPAFSIWERVP
jgi:hypothetical protein